MSDSSSEGGNVSDSPSGTLPAEVDGSALAVTVGCAVVLGGYAAWIAADLLPRVITFLLVLLGSGYFLLVQPSQRARLRYAGYVLAGHLVVTPFLLVLPDVLAADRFGVGPLSLVATTMNAVLFVALWCLGAVVAYASYRVGGRGGDAARQRGGSEAAD